MLLLFSRLGTEWKIGVTTVWDWFKSNRPLIKYVLYYINQSLHTEPAVNIKGLKQYLGLMTGILQLQLLKDIPSFRAVNRSERGLRSCGCPSETGAWVKDERTASGRDVIASHSSELLSRRWIMRKYLHRIYVALEDRDAFCFLNRVAVTIWARLSFV